MELNKYTSREDNTSMLVIHRTYNFGYHDIGKQVMIHNGTVATILTVIKEAGYLTTIYGKCNITKEIIIWDDLGRSNDHNFNITTIWNDK